MKKIFLTFTALGLIAFTSCKNQEEEGVSDVTEQIGNIESDAEKLEDYEQIHTDASKVASDIPQFSNPEIQKFAEEYSAYFNELMQAGEDTEKLHELLGEGVEWSKRVSKITQKMNEEDLDKWSEWSAKLETAANK